MEITWPDNTKDIIDAMRSAIGRNVDFYIERSIPCSACSIDPVTNTSTNSFCVVCSGYGYVHTHDISGILAHVTFGPSENLRWVSAGQYFDGDCRLQVEYTVENMTVIEDSSFVMIDNKKYDKNKVTLRGVQTINRILVDCVERKP